MFKIIVLLIFSGFFDQQKVEKNNIFKQKSFATF